MKRKVWIIIAVTGALLTVLSAVLTGFCVLMFENQSVGIIGGADWPTFAFYFETQYMWLAFLGVAMVVAAVIGMLRKKR